MPKEDPQIKIPDPFLDAFKLYRDEVDEIKGVLKVAIKTFNWILTFVVWVMLIGFLTLLFSLVSLMINSWSENTMLIELKNQKETINQVKLQQEEIIDILNRNKK